jgi:hypothetical protein
MTTHSPDVVFDVFCMLTPHTPSPSPQDEVPIPKSLDLFMARAIAAASPRGLLSRSPSEVCEEEDASHCKGAYDVHRSCITMLDAFLRTTCGREFRDFRLLEMALPFIRGAFSNLGATSKSRITTLAEECPHCFEASGLPGSHPSAEPSKFSDAITFLSGPTQRKAILATLLPTFTALSGPIGQICAIPLYGVTSTFSFVAVSREHKPSIRQAFQLRSLFDIGVHNLQVCPEVFAPIRDFLNREHST